MKKIIVICIFLLLASLLLNGELFPLSTKNDHRSYRPVDALFTALVYTPLVQYKEGHRKRDRLVPFKEASAVMGYCLRHYEIGLGYDLTEKDYCGLSVLPPPKILTMQAVSSSAAGKYSRKDCDGLDLGDMAERESHLLIAEHLYWQQTVENSQKTLASFLRALCPTEAL